MYFIFSREGRFELGALSTILETNIIGVISLVIKHFAVSVPKIQKPEIWSGCGFRLKYHVRTPTQRLGNINENLGTSNI